MVYCNVRKWSNKNGVIYGKKLLRFIDCTIFIKTNQYTNKSMRKLHHITIVQPFDGINLTTSLEETLTFQKLEQVNFTNLETINNIEKSLTQTHFAASGFSQITIIAIVAICIYTFRKFNLYKIRLNVNKDVNNLGTESCSTPTTPPRAANRMQSAQNLNEILNHSINS